MPTASAIDLVAAKLNKGLFTISFSLVDFIKQTAFSVFTYSLLFYYFRMFRSSNGLEIFWQSDGCRPFMFMRRGKFWVILL